MAWKFGVLRLPEAASGGSAFAPFFRVAQRPGDVIYENVLVRSRQIALRVLIQVVVVARAENQQRGAVRAQLRAHRLIGDKIRIVCETGVQKLLDRVGKPRRRRDLSGRQWHAIGCFSLGGTGGVWTE